jgi:hypothetical protein
LLLALGVLCWPDLAIHSLGGLSHHFALTCLAYVFYPVGPSPSFMLGSSSVAGPFRLWRVVSLWTQAGYPATVAIVSPFLRILRAVPGHLDNGEYGPKRT